MTNIGFTGTQIGMTDAQKTKVLEYLCLVDYMVTLHHGGCVGSDSEAHQLALSCGADAIVYPGINKDGVAAKRGDFPAAAEVYPERFYLDRNRDIVDNSDILIATPKGFEEEQRGGTWYTIRYARTKEKPVTIILPDGRLG